MPQKETFIVRTEWWDAIQSLAEKEQATLFSNLFLYHIGQETKINLKNPLVNLVWKLIQPNLERAINNYDKRKDSSRINGLLGGRPPKNSEPIEEPKKPIKPTVTLSDSVSVSDSVNVSVSDSDDVIKSKIKKSENLKEKIFSQRNIENVCMNNSCTEKDYKKVAYIFLDRYQDKVENEVPWSYFSRAFPDILTEIKTKANDTAHLQINR